VVSYTKQGTPRREQNQKLLSQALVAHTRNQEAKIRRIVVQSQPKAKNLQDSTSKIPNTKRADRVSQVVEHLPSKHEALSSKTSIAKNKKSRTTKYSR
jgi:hypothetical protein